MKPPDRWPPRPETAEEQAFRQHREALNRRLRAAYISGVEQRCHREHGRPLTSVELRAALAAYPGDLPTSRVIG